MDKLNLGKNDIIVILIIFVIFGIFMYINTYNTYENFKGIAINTESKEITALNSFLSKLTDYLNKIMELNNSYISVLNIVENDTYVKSNINDVNNILKDLRNIDNTENDSVFNTFFNIHHDYIFNNNNSGEICTKEYSYKKQNLKRLDDNIKNIDIYFNKLKIVDGYQDIMDIFDEYKKVLNDVIKNKSVINTCIYKNKIKKDYNTLTNKIIRSNKNIDKFLINIKNIMDINKKSVEAESLAYDTNSPPTPKLEFETKFCDKLKKLNKPNKSNIIFKRFTNDIIQQKMKYVKKLEDNIKSIQDQMTEKELSNYNLNKLRTNDHATKQYEAIKQAINNIKNRNKVKINLS